MAEQTVLLQLGTQIRPTETPHTLPFLSSLIRQRRREALPSLPRHLPHPGIRESWVLRSQRSRAQAGGLQQRPKRRSLGERRSWSLLSGPRWEPSPACSGQFTDLLQDPGHVGLDTGVDAGKVPQGTAVAPADHPHQAPGPSHPADQRAAGVTLRKGGKGSPLISATGAG